MTEETRTRLEKILGPITDTIADDLTCFLLEHAEIVNDVNQGRSTIAVYEGIARDPMLDVAGLRSIQTDDGDYFYVGDVVQEGLRYRVTIEAMS